MTVYRAQDHEWQVGPGGVHIWIVPGRKLDSGPTWRRCETRDYIIDYLRKHGTGMPYGMETPQIRRFRIRQYLAGHPELFEVCKVLSNNMQIWRLKVGNE